MMRRSIQSIPVLGINIRSEPASSVEVRSMALNREAHGTRCNANHLTPLLQIT
jgi:hypothetical protein